MVLLPIRVLPDDREVLRRKANKVHRIDGSIQTLIDNMIESMYAAQGVGVAAPQVGVSLRVVVIGLPDEEPFALINPEIVKRVGTRRITEGCLSILGYRGYLLRSEKVVVKGLDRNGKSVRIRAQDDLLAQAIEHEIDHIDGTLYIDHVAQGDLHRIEDMPEEDQEDDEDLSEAGARG